MISKVQAYNTNQPNFTSKVRVSDRFARYYNQRWDDVYINNFKKQIKVLENNGNDDFVMIDKAQYGGDTLYMRIYKKVKNKMLENHIDSYAPRTLDGEKGYMLVDIYNSLKNETVRKFSESNVSKILFEYL